MPLPKLPLLCTAVLLLVLVGTGCRPPFRNPSEVDIWHQKTGAERVFFEQVIKDYNKEHPDTRIRVLYRDGEDLRNSFIIAAAAGQGPDLVFGPADNVAVFAETRTVQPWDGVLEPAFLEQFTPQGLVSWQDKLWMVGDQIGNQLMLVYDRSKMDAPPRTLDELVAAGMRLTEDANEDGRAEVYALAWNYTEPYFFIPFLTGFGGWVMDAKGRPTLDNEPTRQALRFILDLRDRYHIIPREDDYSTANLMFLRRRAAMIINGPWSWAQYGVPDRSMIAVLPFNTATGNWCRPVISAKGYSLNINTPASKFPLIQRVLAHLTGEEIQMRMARELFTTPVLKSVVDSAEFRDNPVLSRSMQQARRSIPMPITPRLRQIWDGMRGPLQQVMAGKMTPEEGARAMQQEAEHNITITDL